MKRQSSNEFGFMQVTLVVLMGMFLSLAALALDLGNLYLWRLRAQKAAHAGAMAGLGYRINNGWTNTMSQSGAQALKDVASQTVRDNFSMYGAANQPVVNIGFRGKSDTIDVSVTYEAPTFLVGRLNNFFNFGLQRSSTTVALSGIQGSAQLNPASVVLLLDVSGSMTSNIGNLINAATTFVQQFNPETDHISIIPFNIGAQVQYPFVPVGFDNVAILNYLQTLSGNTRSNTNHCDALTEAIAVLNAFAPAGPLRPDLRPSVVFFTDGAPNALRATFTRVHPKGVSGGPRDQDAYLYAVEWFDGSTTTPYAYRGPGPVVARPNIALGAANPMFGFQIQTNQVAPLGWPFYPQDFTTDVANVSNPLQFRKILDRSGGSTNGSLQNLDFFVTGTTPPASVTGIPFESAPTTTRDPRWPPRFFQGLPAGTTYNYQYFDQLPYYCAIEAADYIRRTFSGTIYTIGLGEGAPNGPDPFQDADLSDSANPANPAANPRKDYFLARLAYAAQATSNGTSWGSNYDFSTVRTIGVNSTNSPVHRYSTSGSPPLVIGNAASNSNPDLLRPAIPYDGTNGRRYDTQGEYFPTTNPNDLPEIYNKIARSILLRAVQ